MVVYSGGSWWKWPGGLRNFISGWTYRFVALHLAVYNGVSSHPSSPKLIKLEIFSCPYWFIENIHFSSIKPNPNPKHEHKRINPTGPMKIMTHNQCHQSCKGTSWTQDHLHTKPGTFCSTAKVLLLIWQSIAFYSNRVMAADLGYSYFLLAGTFIMFFQMKFKFSKKIQTVYDFVQNLFFLTWCYAFPVKACILNKLPLQCSPKQKSKGLLECWKVCQTFHASKCSHFNVLNQSHLLLSKNDIPQLLPYIFKC